MQQEMNTRVGLFFPGISQLAPYNSDLKLTKNSLYYSVPFLPFPL